MKKLPDKAIQRKVRKQAFAISRVSRLLYINKHGEVIAVKWSRHAIIMAKR